MLELPTNTEVQQAMDEVLAEAARLGRAATVTAVERLLGLRHATFYRHYQPLITNYFRPRAQAAADDQTLTATAATEDTDQKTTKRLRQENTELRKLTNIYGETIRQLTLRNEELEKALNAQAGVTSIRPLAQ